MIFLIPFGIALAHLILWVLAKGTIWVVAGLFNVNWADKFWFVYVAILILSLITGSKSSK